MANQTCTRFGCTRPVYSTFEVCSDDRQERGLCAECDVALNWLALSWWGDIKRSYKMMRYIIEVQEKIGRDLETCPLCVSPEMCCMAHRTHVPDGKHHNACFLR